MIKFKLLGVIAAAGILAGCSNIDKLRTAEPTGSAFTQALTSEYRMFTVNEADNEYDWPDANYFARKGLSASAGEAVLPEELGAWDLPADKVDELAQGRARLMAAFDMGARERFPELAARAQVLFDCWVEQQEENHQPQDIAACRDEFLKAMDELEALLAPQAAQPPMPKEFIVYFDFDKSNITAAGRAVINEVLASVQASGSPDVTIVGHTDLAGTQAYNLALSLRRADAVRNALISGGVPAEKITTSGRGEEEPAVPTRDGVPEAMNRRAVIVVQ